MRLVHTLDDADQTRLTDLRARSPRLNATADHVTVFARTMSTLTGVG